MTDLYQAMWPTPRLLSPESARKTMASILDDVALRRNISKKEIIGPSRCRRAIEPRFEAMWLMRQENRWSLPQIGRFMGWRDHTSVLNAVRRYQGWLDAEEPAET